MPVTWPSSVEECHENPIKEQVRRGDGFSTVSVEFFDRFWFLLIITVVMHLSQDNLGCTLGLYAMPSESLNSGNFRPLLVAGEGCCWPPSLTGPGSGPGP